MKPNLFIVWAPRCATTSLSDFLSLSDEIIMSKIKEPHYFAKDFNPDRFKQHNQSLITNDVVSHLKRHPNWVNAAFVLSENEYLKLFDFNNDCAYYWESSVWYLYSQVAASNIHNFNPSAKIIAILRNPIDRALSHYAINIDRWLVDTSFSEMIDAERLLQRTWRWVSNVHLELWHYSEQLIRFEECFDSANILLLDYHSLISNAWGELKKLWDFLWIVLDFESFPQLNSSTKKPMLQPSELDYLRHYYKKEIINLNTRYWFNFSYDWDADLERYLKGI